MNLGSAEADGLAFQGADKWFYYTSGGLYNGNSGGRQVGVVNLKAGDVVTFTADETLTVAGNATATATANQFTVNADGNAYFSLVRNKTITLITVTREVHDDVCETPTYNITTADGTKRKFTLGCLTPSSTIYYSETEKTASDAGWTEYTGEVTTSAANIWVYAKTDKATSDVITFATGAGSAVKLNAPVIKQTSFTEEEGYYYHTYTFTADQSDVLGKPTATITYSFDGGAETEGSSLVAEREGNLTVTVSAEGYESSQTTTRVSGGQFAKTYSFDAITEVTRNDGIDWTSGGSANSVNGAGWSFASLDQVTYSLREDITLTNFSYARATTADTNQGFYARNGKGTVNYSLHGAEEIQFTMLDGSNVYATAASTSTSFNQYSNIRKIEIFTPAHVTIDVTDAGWATYYTPFALDFTKEDDYYTPGELTAYTAKLVDGEVVLTKVDNVPAGTGVVLKADEGDYYVPVAASSTTERGDLKGNNDQETDVEDFDGWTFYVLGINGDDQAQFQRASGGYIPAGKAYLMVASGEARALNVVVADSETTGVSEKLNVSSEKSSTAVYNMQGQRVAQPTKGLYIVNGKKVIVK